MVAGAKRGRHSRKYVVATFPHLLILTSFSSHRSCAVELSSNYLTDNNTRRTLIPTFLPPLMTYRYYPFFVLLTRAPHPVMTVSTNACLKLGLLHHLFPFSCHAINNRKTHAVCCGCSSDILLLHKRRVDLSLTRCTFRFARIFLQPPHSSSRSCLLFLLLLALHIVLAHTSVYVCAQYNALTPRTLDERNNVYALPQGQLSMGFPLTKFENIIRYSNRLPSYPRIDMCSNGLDSSTIILYRHGRNSCRATV